MQISFRCPHCKVELSFEDLSHEESPCPQCGENVPLHIGAAMRERNQVEHCAICNCPSVYLQKDFNRNFGFGIIVVTAIICMIMALQFNWVWQAYTLLFAVVAADMLLYKLLPDVIICYRCHTQYRGFSRSPAAAPFELGLAEKYDPIDKKPAAENPAAEWKQR